MATIPFWWMHDSITRAFNKILTSQSYSWENDEPITGVSGIKISLNEVYNADL